MIHHYGAQVRQCLGVCLAVAGWMLAPPAAADALDQAYWRTFYILPIGGYDNTPGSSNYLGLVRERLLAQTGGVQPANIKAGFSMTANFISSTYDSYYDYLYNPAYAPWEMDTYVPLAWAHNLPYGVHFNGTPWADPADQSMEVLSNYLEKNAGGALLQRDRLGRIRRSAVTQEPTSNEYYDGFGDMLEMQLTLSRNATVVQDYMARNCRVAMRLLGWHREQHPDLLVFASMSSEYSQNANANSEYCDYSTWSQQEFRDWLGGTGLYAGQGQYASLSAFNAAFSGASGFPYPTWAAVTPPTTVDWSTSTANGRWWNQWHAFRIIQVRNMVQAQIRWSRQAGWSPDQLFGHQIPFDPASTDSTKRKIASPWTTAFVDDGGNGITTYGTDAANATIFNAMYTNDHSWGIFEWNRLDASMAVNLAALNAVWNGRAHLLSPYNWYGQPTYQILDKPLQAALAQFIYERRTNVWTGLNYWEVTPVARDAIWGMNEAGEIENHSGVSQLQVTNGVLYGTVDNADALLWCAVDDSAHYVMADNYQAASFRLYLTNAVAGTGKLVWVDEADAMYALDFTARAGWNVYHLNLANHAAWREKRIKAIALRPGTPPAGSAFALDWVRLEAQPCWHFDNVNEIYGAQNLGALDVSGGSVNAITATDDGYFYLATDKRDPSQDADRAGIDADYFTQVRVRMNSSASGMGQLYWWQRGSPAFWHEFPVQAGTHTYAIDLAVQTNWAGTVTRLRLDPVNMPGATVQVSYVAITPRLLPPRMASDDLVLNTCAPVFLWDGAVEPDDPGITYTVQLADDFFFTNIVYAADGVTGDRHYYAGDLRDGLHWWRVGATSATGARAPWPVPMPVFLRPWTFDRSADIWLANDCSAPLVTNGIWQTTTTGADPYLYFNIGNGRGINADLYKVFRCRVKVGTAAANGAQFIFLPRGGSYHAVDLTLPADNQWHDLAIDLRANPDWTGAIQYARLDPGAQAGLTVALDLACMMPTNAMVTSATWDGGGTDNSWDTPANWVGNNAPLSDAAVVFAGATRLAPSNAAAGRNISGITFANGAGAFTVGGATLTNSGNIVNHSGVPQAISLNLVARGAGWQADTRGGDLVLQGVLAGNATALVKLSSNMLSLAHAGNTYSGATIVSAGTLRVSGRTGSGAVSVAGSATIEGSGVVNAPLTLASDATLAPGPGLATLAINGALLCNAGAQYAWQAADAGSADLVSVTGTLHLPGAPDSMTVNVFRASGTPYGPYVLCSTTTGINGASNAVRLVYHDGLEGAPHPAVNSTTLTVNLVPEPGVCCALAFLGLLLLRRA
ncbi:MAG: hypothetical protein NTV22_02230 [bacterium]|nr:hypothetical protein [bacterium]